MDHVFDIVIDVQNDFMKPDGALYVPGAETIIQPLQNYLANLDGHGVLFTYDTHILSVYETSEEAKQFPPHCLKASYGWELAIDPALASAPKYKLEKGVFNMWEQPVLFVHSPTAILDREVFFAELHEQGITTLRFCGVAADYCVKWAIDGALQREFEVQVIGNLTKGIQRDMHQVVHDEFAGRVTIV